MHTTCPCSIWSSFWLESVSNEGHLPLEADTELALVVAYACSLLGIMFYLYHWNARQDTEEN
jgi:hypothetical protein